MEALSGRDVEIDQNDNVSIDGEIAQTAFFRKSMPLGIIPHYKYEINYWVTLIHKYPQYEEVLRELISITERKIKASNDLFNYSKMPYRFRVRKNSFVQDVPNEDWKKIVQSLREFILY